MIPSKEFQLSVKNHAPLQKEDPNYVYNKACIRLLITESVHTKILKLSISKAEIEELYTL